MLYVDVILPLPLEGIFTYSLEAEDENRALPGMRVLVPFGKSKTYIGIVHEVHDRKPEFPVRSVSVILDQQPILLPWQMQVWEWISFYYVSSLGDIYNAAVPAGLKTKDGYKLRKETFVSLSERCRNEKTLLLLKGSLKRAFQQQEMLTCYLKLSNWDSLKDSQPQKEIKEITREELLNESHGNASVLKALTDKDILSLYEKEVGRLNRGGETHFERIKELNLPQTKAYEEIIAQMELKSVVLLHGVTSSGKTEIYIHLMQKAISEHRQVLYLLPEIALTVQIMERLKSVFGNRLGIYHSKYNDAERAEIWRKQLSENPYDVILGVRSAVFLPFRQLGLVIIDEEHDSSFKQQDPAPRYHARSVAIVLAQMCGAKVLLGTATPSMESYYNASTGKYGLVKLSTRYQGIELPRIEVVDTKDLYRRKMMNGPFSPRLVEAMGEALRQEKQILLFQNRRGYAQMVECKQCGWVPKCDNCDVSLTLHETTRQLSCHYCGFTYRIPDKCPKCGNTHLVTRGYGTEQIEDMVRKLFPEANVARMDLDTTRSKNAYGRIIDNFSSGKTHILIGTQMITKGFDFDRVSVVGILSADNMLNYPDFRAYEQAFMLMSQVSGRAGRKGKQGLVLLQTKNKELPVIEQIVHHDYEGFYNDLLEERRLFRYPPFYHLIYVYLKHAKEDVVDSAAIEMGSRLRVLFGERVLGPDKPAVSKVKSLFIRKLIIKLENGVNQRQVRENLKVVRQQLFSDKRFVLLKMYFDIDPM